MKPEFVARYDGRNIWRSRRAIFFEISLIADNGLELPVDALLDTGFSGWLAMNDQDLDGLDWTYVKQ